MVLFFASLLRLFLEVFRSKRTIVSEIALLRKENEILLRRIGNKRVQPLLDLFHSRAITRYPVNPLDSSEARYTAGGPIIPGSSSFPR